MNVFGEVKRRETRIAWISRANGSRRMAWVGESLLAGRIPMEASCYGR
jgi:hypothetical protein